MENIKCFKNQDYNLLIRKHNKNNLFEDPYFPAIEKSLYYTQKAPSGIVWKRPSQVTRNPQFVVDGFSRCDMDQGYVGNCWFIAGCVGIMQSPTLFAKVVPQNQSFTENYAGIFHFRFWLYGEWVDVVVDDRLPFWSDGKLVFACNKEQPNEYWASLLEKAYAKLYGNYENLDAGQTTDALIDMSGGLEETFDLTKMGISDKEYLWTILFQAYNKNSIMGCSIIPDPSVREAKLANGLVKGHAYTITKLVNFDLNGKETKLVRIRNPWGNEVEWKGAWSDNSRNWNLVSSDIKEDIGLVNERDGEFWMEYSDFLANWHSVQICHLSADSFSDNMTEGTNLENLSWRKLLSDEDSSWKCTIFHSEWAKGKTAGGSGVNNQAKFWTNPQFLIKVEDVDSYDNENKATIIVALMQKDSRLKRLKNGDGESAEEYIQFKLFRIKNHVSVDETKSTGLKLYSNQLDRIGASGSYINSREVTKRFRVEPGYYLIVPSTYDEDRSCEFLIRVFTEQFIETSTLEQHKDDLNEDEFFLDIQDTDQIFNSWADLMGVASNENEDEQEEEEEAAYEGHKNKSLNKPSAKEACSLM